MTSSRAAICCWRMDDSDSREETRVERSMEILDFGIFLWVEFGFVDIKRMGICGNYEGVVENDFRINPVMSHTLDPQKSEELVDKGKKANTEVENNVEIKDVLDEIGGTWNIRGVSTSDKQDEIVKLIQKEKLQICVVFETHLKSKKIELWWDGMMMFGPMTEFKEKHGPRTEFKEKHEPMTEFKEKHGPRTEFKEKHKPMTEFKEKHGPRTGTKYVRSDSVNDPICSVLNRRSGITTCSEGLIRCNRGSRAMLPVGDMHQ
nr:RNA-directed DNA polymerase, eukaryota, reverse transcriptase zinc-binding domain protein [Tanacetum cinerariifolium]